MLFQSAALFPWLTVEQNALFGPKARGALTRKARERAAFLIAIAGLHGFEGAYPHQLSGGMRQRAAFVRALVMEPTVLLMDEPFGALDAITRQMMQSFLLSLTATQHPTVLFVTHDVGEATLLADRVVIMSPRPGRIAYNMDIPIARPRQTDVVETMEFVRVRKVLRERLESVIKEAVGATAD
jgi:NitT/TauT family transport system ATP-binding protein